MTNHTCDIYPPIHAQPLSLGPAATLGLLPDRRCCTLSYISDLVGYDSVPEDDVPQGHLEDDESDEHVT